MSWQAWLFAGLVPALQLFLCFGVYNIGRSAGASAVVGHMARCARAGLTVDLGINTYRLIDVQAKK